MLATLFVLILILSFLSFFDIIYLTLTYSQNTLYFARIQNSELRIRWIPAVLIYLLIPFGIWMFVDLENPMRAFSRGAALGATMYGVYDLTNYATLENWTLRFTIQDILWGTFLCGAAAGLTSSITRFLK